MNLKQLSILIVLVLLVGGVGRVLYQRNAASWQSSERATEQKLLGEFPINDIAQVVIKQQASQVTLVKSDDLWKVKERYDYAANYSDLHEFLRKLWELKAVQRQQVGASLLGRFDLLAADKGTNAATVVELKDKSGKTIKSILLGKKHMRKSSGGASPFGGEDPGWPDGRFVLVPDSATQPDVCVVTEPFSNIEPKAEQWIAKEFIKIEKVKAVSLVSTNATNSWRITREKEGGELQLADKKAGEELDASKTWSIGSILSSATIVDVLSPDSKPEAFGFDKPIAATVETFDNFTYGIQVGRGTNDDQIPVRLTVSAEFAKERVAGKDEKPEDKAKLDKEFKDKLEKLQEKLKQEKAFEKWTVVLAKYSVEGLLKSRADLLKKEEKKEAGKEDKKDSDVDAGVPGLEGLNLDAKPVDDAKPANPPAGNGKTE
jgi:hypothetical protein